MAETLQLKVDFKKYLIICILLNRVNAIEILPKMKTKTEEEAGCFLF